MSLWKRKQETPPPPPPQPTPQPVPQPVPQQVTQPQPTTPQQNADDFTEVPVTDFQEVTPQPTGQEPTAGTQATAPVDEFVAVDQPQTQPLPPAPQTVPEADTMQMVTGAPSVSTIGGMERLDNVERTLNDVVNRLNSLDKFTESVKGDIKTVKESISSMESTMRELTSLYDLISSQINPFIDIDIAKGKEDVKTQDEVVQAELDAIFEKPESQTSEELPEEMQIDTGIPPAVQAQPQQIQISQLAPPPRVARLTEIGADPMCWVALLRWIEFLLERVKRDQLSSLLSHYVKIGWISEGIRSQIISEIRGIKPTPTMVSGLEASKTTKDGDVVMAYQKETLRTEETQIRAEDDWKLTIDDHLKSLIFIERIRGTEISKDKLEELERDFAKLKKSVSSFYSL